MATTGERRKRKELGKFAVREKCKNVHRRRTITSSLQEALDDIKAGRVNHYKSAEEMFDALGI